MLNIADILKSIPEKDIVKSMRPLSRKDLIDEFYEELRKQTMLEQRTAMMRQRETGMKQKIWPVMPYMVVRNRLDGLKEVWELSWFLGYCKESSNFAKCFYYMTSTKPR